VTTTRTAIDNVGHETTTSCTTGVFSKVITGTVSGKLVVRVGESVELTSTAVAARGITVVGGTLDIEGASVGGLRASGPSQLRICAARVTGALKVSGASGPVVIGDPARGCASSTFGGSVKLGSNQAGLSVIANTFGGALKVTGNAGGTTVTNNKVAGSLTVTGNTGTVVDKPNEVKGKSKLQ